MTAATLGVLALLALAALRLPMAVALFAVGLVGTGWLGGWAPAAAGTAQLVFDTGFRYPLAVVPLLVWMGHLSTQASLGVSSFNAAQAWLGPRPGGLGLACVAASATQGAASGSAIGTTAAIARAARPWMQAQGHDPTLAAGALAAGGALGALVPPSLALVVYGLASGVDLGRLFLASTVPAALAVAGLWLVVCRTARRRPWASPPMVSQSAPPRTAAALGLAAVWLPWGLLLAGLGWGSLDAVEAVALGCFGAFLLALLRGALTPRALLGGLIDSASASAALVALLMGALVFGHFLTHTSLQADLRSLANGFALPPAGWVTLLLLATLLLTRVLEGLSALLIVVPFGLPLVQALGLDPAWFGVLLLVVLELGLIMPPSGQNLAVVRAIWPELDPRVLGRGLRPFVLASLLRLALLVAVPALALWLPSLAG